MNVLPGIDFAKVSIDVLTIENNHNDESIRSLMFKNNFVLWEGLRAWMIYLCIKNF